MSGVTPLVDTLLATRLGQRLDLLALKAQAEIAGPGAVVDVQKVGNDVRLPTREPLQRERGLGIAPAGRHGGLGNSAAAGSDGAVMLSAAARTVSALLKLPVGSTPAVRGLAPLQPDMRPPEAPALAAALARTVDESGLFYESHLRHFAAGHRTLAQLAHEPQAGLAAPASGLQSLEVSPPSQAAAPVAAGAALASLAALLEGMAALPRLPSQPASSPLPPLLLEGGPVLEIPETEMAIPPATGDAGHSGPLGAVTTYGPSGLPDSLPSIHHDFSVPDAGASVSSGASSDTARAAQPVAAIHPEAVGLVRQQLEMLAQPVFRWSGEGWPGIPMDWEIRQEEQQEREEQRQAREGGSPEAAPASWLTRLTLELPRLGKVGVHLGLAGTALQLRLDASREGTAAVLDQAGGALARRLEDVGLALKELRIGEAGGSEGAW
jgi:hypothetical protein